MFKIKRPAVIGLLVVLLVFTGYINHQLTQQAIKKTSKEYQDHEVKEKEKYLSENNILEAQGDDETEMEIELNDDQKNEEKNNDEDNTKDEKENEVKKENEDEKENEDVDNILESNNKKTEDIISQEASATNRNYFVEYRLSRDKLRANSIDRLNQIIDNNKTNEKMISEAQEGVIKIGKTSEKELQIEGLIKSKGFDDALVFLTDEDVKVIVSADELKEEDTVRILDILKSETKYDMNNIKIMKKQ